MTHKRVFLGCAIVGFLGLCVSCLALIALAVAGFLQPPTGVAVFNLFVDIVVGVFTVWGLFWAASEFSEQSLKPQLGLILGEQEINDGKPAYNPIDSTKLSVCGHTSLQGQGWVEIGLFLENRRPRMAERIQLAIEVESNPQVSGVSPKLGSSVYKYHENITRNKVVLRFEDDLVVYQGEGVLLGVLRVDWPQAPLPSVCELRHTIYKAEGRPDIGRHMICIDWQQGILPA